MKLVMRSTLFGDLAQDLPLDDDEVYTDQLGSCGAVVVLWNYDDQAQSYLSVRGYHGNGGFQSIHLESLFDGVPNNDPKVRIYGFIGTTNKNSKVEPEWFRALIGKYFPSAEAWLFYTPDAVVGRNGDLGFPDEKYRVPLWSTR